MLKADRCLLFTHDKTAHAFHIINAWPPLQAGGASSDIWLAGRHAAANMLDHKVAQMNLLETQETLQQANCELHASSVADRITIRASASPA